MDETVRWTDLSVKEIVQLLRDGQKMTVSKSVVRKLLHKHHYRRRKAQKRQTMKAVKHRNEQFETIQRLKNEYEAAGNPIVSMDTKKKELLGNFYRDGHLYTLEELRAYDHDFKSFADGVIIPHSLYDLHLNVGYIQLGTSHDTSEFACDRFRTWWFTYGCIHYPDATSILVLCGLFRAFGEAGLRVTSGIYPCAELFSHILPTYSQNSHRRPVWHGPHVACRVPLPQEEAAFILPPILAFLAHFVPDRMTVSLQGWHLDETAAQLTLQVTATRARVRCPLLPCADPPGAQLVSPHPGRSAMGTVYGALAPPCAQVFL